jgi:ribosomal protein S18 acetylase RimI-like enzyme
LGKFRKCAGKQISGGAQVISQNIRPATLDDVDEIARVHVQAWRETYRGLVPDRMLEELSVADRATLWRSVIADPANAAALLVLEDGNGALVGFGSAGRAPNRDLQTDGEITAIYLLDAVKRRGFGRVLFTRLLAELTNKGFPSAGLWVLASNAPACRFYEAMGGSAGFRRSEEHDGAALTEIAYSWQLPR